MTEGISHGFHIVDPGADIESYEVTNHKSARDPASQECLDAFILGELDSGNYVACRAKPRVVSAIGAVPKSSGGFRLIHDLSM